MIALENLYKTYKMGDQTVHALQDISLQIDKNEYVAFIGASGSGKSTMMNILGCLDRPTSGNYRLNGTDVSGMSQDALADVRNKEIGFIFQSFHLLPRASALDNVLLPLIYRDKRVPNRQELAKKALEMVGLAERMDHKPNQLSGGQRQRVAIARALISEPSILLADEPTGNLDSQTTLEILALFDQLHERGHTVIMVTHEADVAARCHRVIRLQDGKVQSDIRSREAA
ncbi:ABC transporter ATP-binding protein [Permianibacter aggregans]|uniref:Putative ABC transport system ATP-binding protein n=1 Tax=Permianibacter aggregans TaxID=1510150 RepID=A0A4R6UUV7_9GAMM|nr:ABC transporter ATP-binding protein [Permianibacter aggregans]QGX41736.1 ABC transporter ATP-binding protein [Permianibacter aggregans]TDQ49699.1 putative ABC transport system ATP-binding protein [Permianibacter aggregans]